MLICVIRYHIDPARKDTLALYACNGGEAISRCAADLVGYFAPHEGSRRLTDGIYSIPSLANHVAHRARLAGAPLGRENYLSAHASPSCCARTGYA